MVLPGRFLYIRRKIVVGRLTKEMKKESEMNLTPLIKTTQN